MKNIADLYDCNYQKSTSINELNSAILKYKNQIGIHIVDAQIDIQKNKKALARIKKQIKKG